MSTWSFLSPHGRALVYVADHPDARLRDIATALDVTERTAFGLIADLTAAGYVVKERDGRRNRYHIEDHLPVPDPIVRERSIREIIDLLGGGRTERTTDEPPTPRGGSRVR